MRIGIICASDRELEPFIQDILEEKCSEKAMLQIHEGKIGCHEIIYLYSGVCKVNAAIATQMIIDMYHVDLVINAGVAGGIDSKINILDTVIGTEVAYHDVDKGILTDYHPWMQSVYFKMDEKFISKLGKLAERINTEGNIYFGKMVTGEKFISGDDRQAIIDSFKPLSVDMETGSIAHVCYVNKVPFISIRSITDTADNSASTNFENNCKKASEIAKNITLAFINDL